MHIIRLPETDSTNEELRRINEKTTLPDFTIVITDHQTAGRGQIGNKWHSEPKQNILMSILLRNKQLDIHNQFFLSMIVALAVKKAIGKYIDNVKIKWPNDIYVDNKKIAGILIENKVRGKVIYETIAGIGINVNQVQFDSCIPNPTSVRLITGSEMPITNILNELILLMPRGVDLISNERWSDIKALYMNDLYRYDGKYYRFKDSNSEFEAILTDIAPDGQLILTDKNGTRRSYFLKEVEHIL